MIQIDSTVIRQDTYGRYCINDLHKAAGGLAKDRPAYWLCSQQPQALVDEVGKAGNPALEVIYGGNHRGTYVCKELVYAYAYAMWISPAFNLKVIRAYDRLATQGVAVHEDRAEDVLKNPLVYMRKLW